MFCKKDRGGSRPRPPKAICNGNAEEQRRNGSFEDKAITIKPYTLIAPATPSDAKVSEHWVDIPDDEKARGKTRQKISDNIGALENQRQLALVAGTSTVDLRYRIAVAKRNYLMFQPLHRQLENGKKSRDTAKERLEATLEAAKIAAENVKAIKAAISVWDAGFGLPCVTGGAICECDKGARRSGYASSFRCK